MDTLQINSIKRAIGQLYMQIGIKNISDAISDFTDTQGDFNQFTKPFSNFSVYVPISQLDEKYYFTSIENWQKIMDTINPILRCKGWLAERFDCDKRSFLVTALTALLFEINTVRPIWCDVYAVSDGTKKYSHYANVFVDNNGNAYLWDVDNQGQFTKITSDTVIIGSCKYKLLSIR
jgi:hypothetical protein